MRPTAGVRIPREFELEGTEVLMRKEGDRLILTPIRKNRRVELLAAWEPLDEGLPSDGSALELDLDQDGPVDHAQVSKTRKYLQTR